MALKDDHIKWILDLDGGGVQKELALISVQSKALADNNKALSIEIKQASKQMNDAEKEMNKLAKAGDTTSVAYKEAKGTFESAKIEVSDYRKRVEENTKAIDDNNEMTKKVIQSMKLEDMTMGQLKTRAKELGTQLENTSKSGSPEAYVKLEKELTAVTGRMGDLKTKGKSLSDQLGSIPGPAGAAITSVQGLGSAFKLLVLNPVGLVLTAIVAALMLLYKAFMSTDSGATMFAGVLKGLGNVLDILLDRTLSFFKLLGSIATFDMEGIKKNGQEAFGGIADSINDAAKAGYEYAQTMDAINDREFASIKRKVLLRAEVEKLKNQSKDAMLSDKERLKLAELAFKKETELLDLETKFDIERTEVEKKNLASKINNSKLSLKQKEALVENWLKIDDRELESAMRNNAAFAKFYNENEDEFQKLQELKGKDYEKSAEFETRTRRLQQSISGFKKDLQNEETARNKQWLATQISNNEQALQREINALKKKRSESLMTESEYNAQVEIETRKSLERKMKIKGLESDKILAIQAQLYDMQIKEKEKFEKLLSDTSIQISIETKSYNDRLKAADIFGKDLNKLTIEQLDEKNTIDTEYQKRLLEIAIKAEDERLKTEIAAANVSASSTGKKLKVYELLQQQHEANIQKIKDDSNKTQQDAQAAVDKAIIDSIVKANDAQIKANEAVTTASLQAAKTEFANGTLSKKQYEDEVDRINSEGLSARLQAQQEFNDLLAGLEMAATPEYIAALQASQKAVADTQSKIDDQKIKQHEKFESEKSKITNKYAKGSILGEYEIKKAALKKEYDEGLLSEQEFQEEKRKIKIEAAKKYNDQVSSVVTAGSNFVTALQSAETATVQADYQKRLAGLNENDADYAAKKEKLQHDQAVAELEVQKKYADAQFGIQVAQIGVATASGIMNAWSSSMILGPILGPIAAGAMTALLVGTGIAQVAAAAAERNKIKAMTIESSGSSSASSNKTGTIEVNNPGFSDGGYTGDGDRLEVAGDVHRLEYVVAPQEMSNPVTAAYVRKIDNVKQQRSKRNPLPAGFADGGYTGDSNSSGNNGSRYDSFIIGLENWLAELKSTKLEAEINYWEFKRSSVLAEDYKKLGARE